MAIQTLERHPISHHIYTEIKQLLTHCDQEHSHCKRMQSQIIGSQQQLPSLLLDVSDHKVKLIQPDSLGIRYAALSYRWGTLPFLTTTQNNLNSHLDQIPFDTLPKTMKDAISITRELGLQYIWIDSLCIIQDSLEHMHSELGKMSQIYSSAYITISASCSWSCSNGFLADTSSTVIQLPFQCGNGETGMVNLYDESLGDMKRDKSVFIRSVEPVDSRAWIFQEHFLSPRLLRFNLFQPALFCCESKWAPQESVPETASCRTKLNLPDDWLRILENYSYRQLTKPEDKLPAISSIAAYLAPIIKSEYLAGLWKADIDRQLCWFAGGPVQKPPWRAPSWSPMSVNGIIRYPWFGKKFKSTIEVLDAKCSILSDKVPYGRVTDGWLLVRGTLSQVAPEFKEWDPVHRRLIGHGGSQLEQAAFETTIMSTNTWDLHMDDNGSHDYSTWVDAMTNGYYHLRLGLIYGLLLIKLADGKFQRVGFARDKLVEGSIHWFLQGKNYVTTTATITLV